MTEFCVVTFHFGGTFRLYVPYPAGIKVSDDRMRYLEERVIERAASRGEQHYAILPAPRPAPGRGPEPGPPPGRPGRVPQDVLNHPALTGIATWPRWPRPCRPRSRPASSCGTGPGAAAAPARPAPPPRTATGGSTSPTTSSPSASATTSACPSPP